VARVQVPVCALCHITTKGRRVRRSNLRYTVRLSFTKDTSEVRQAHKTRPSGQGGQRARAGAGRVSEEPADPGDSVWRLAGVDTIIMWAPSPALRGAPFGGSVGSHGMECRHTGQRRGGVGSNS